MHDEEYGYKVLSIDLNDLPDEVNRAFFHDVAWKVELHGKPKAFAISQNFAEMIVMHNLARDSINLGQAHWYECSVEGRPVAVCDAMTKRLIDDYFSGPAA